MPCRLGRAPLPVVGFSLVRLRPGPAAPAGRGWWILGKPNLRISNLWSSDEPPKVRGGQQRSGASPPPPDVLSGAPRCPRPLSPAAPLWLSCAHDGAPLWLSRTHVPRRRALRFGSHMPTTARAPLWLSCAHDGAPRWLSRAHDGARARALRFGPHVPRERAHQEVEHLADEESDQTQADAIRRTQEARKRQLTRLTWPTKRAIRRNQTQSDALKRHSRGN